MAVDANEQAAQEHYQALPLETKGRIGIMLANLQTAPEQRPIDPLTIRNQPPQTRDLTTRGFSLRAESVNAEDRSVEAVIVSEDPVTVYDWRSRRLIEEVLRIDGAELPAQVPLLNSHSRWSLDDVFGSVRGIARGDGRLLARLYFARGDDAIERAWQKVLQGHLRDVSAGYRVLESTEIEPGQTAVVAGRSYTAGRNPLRIATRWALKEVSLVPIGADEVTKIREARHSPLTTDHSPLPLLESSAMNPKLRKYLESLGLRADAPEADAIAFWHKLEGGQRTEADKLATADGQRTDPSAQPQRNQPAGATAAAGNLPEIAGTIERTAVGMDDIAREAIAAERARVREITELAAADVRADLRQQAINEGWDVNRANREFLADVRTSRQPGQGLPAGAAPYQATAQSQPMHNASARSLAAGLMLAMGTADPTRHAMHTGRRDPAPSDVLTPQDADQGHRFARMSAIDLLRQCVLMDTGRLYWDPAEAFEAARATPSGGTLAYVFSTNVYARIIAGWDEVPDTTAWCDEEDVPNFLTQEDISLEADARLKRLARGGTATDATISDAHEQYKIARFARKWTVDEQDLIDDRLGAILRMPQEMGAAARRLRPDLVYACLLANAVLADTGALFNATAVTTAGGHANLTTAVLGATGLKAAILAMGKYRLKDGTALNIKPRYLMVPSALQWTAKELLTSTAQAYTAAAAAATPALYYPINVLMGENITLVVDDRIGAAGVVDPTTNTARTGLDTNWFLSSGGPRTIRVAYRRGTNRQPVMRSFTLDKGQWGQGWDINMDIGAKALDYRGLHQSTGAG